MMPPAHSTLLTVEEFAKLKDPPAGRYELHHGELVLVPPPVDEHAHVQRQLMLILNRICTDWYVRVKFAFRPFPEYEVWVADIGMVSKQRFRDTPRQGWLDGSPDLVVEVVSPSNRPQDLTDREQTCFRGGCREFWVVDPDAKSIRVSTPDGDTHTYSIAGEIPLNRFVPGALILAEVFATL